MPEFKGSEMIFSLLPAGRVAKGIAKGASSVIGAVSKRKAADTTRKVDVEKLLKEAFSGPDKRTAAQKKAADSYFKKTFKP